MFISSTKKARTLDSIYAHAIMLYNCELTSIIAVLLSKKYTRDKPQYRQSDMTLGT